MKRILSIILCVAMLVSSAAMSTVAWDQSVADSITNENVMSFILNKDSYMPGDEVTITAHMDSIWGDSSIEGVVDGYSLEAEGAYGMALFAAGIVFPTDVFTAKSGRDFKKNSDIENYNSDHMITITKTENAVANNRGFYSMLIESETIYTWEDEDTGEEYKKYAFFNGSGDLCQFRFTISEDAAPGTYKLPIGPFGITTADGAEVGQPPEYQFTEINDNYFYNLGNVDSSAYDRDVRYVSPTGEYVNDDCTKGAYITIVIEGDEYPIVPPVPPVVEDPMEFEFAAGDNAYAAGETVEVNLSVKNNKEGLDVSSVNSEFKFDNTALKLIEVSSPVAGFGSPDLNYDALNTQGKYEDLGKLTAIDCYFDGSGSFEGDGTVVTLKFEVLPTAAGASTTVTGVSREGVVFTDAVVKLAANHSHKFTETTVPASCTATGYTDTACTCGLTYRIADIAKLAHVASTDPKDTITVAATCDKQGYTTTYCANCGKVAKTTYNAALGHDLVSIKSEVSCITDGYEMKKCARCDYETEKVIFANKFDHKNPDGTSAYGEAYVAQKPTTNAVGYMGKACSICGDVNKFEEIPKLPIYWGDCNMEGKINIADVVVLLQYIAKWQNLYFSTDNADVTHDGRINILDATKLLKYIAKWDVNLGEGSTVI